MRLKTVRLSMSIKNHDSNLLHSDLFDLFLDKTLLVVWARHKRKDETYGITMNNIAWFITEDNSKEFFGKDAEIKTNPRRAKEEISKANIVS